MGIAHVLGSSPFQAFSQGSTLCGVGIWISVDLLFTVPAELHSPLKTL